MEKLDILVASCIAHGLYITTDLYVSRAHVVSWRALGIDRNGPVKPDAYKILVAFHEPAFSNLCAWTRTFLGHVNPHTGRSLAQEPALCALALVNEGNLGNFGMAALRDTPGVAASWQAWLAAKRNDDALRANDGRGKAANDDGAPRQMMNDATIPSNLNDPEFAAFLAERETILFERLKAFVRDECGCKAPLSTISAWYNPLPYQLTRMHFDYVDNHFYVDHPQFLGVPWRLPSRCPNVNPFRSTAKGAQKAEWYRLMDKPFCVTEFNYSGPGRFRGVGGVALGTLAALQNWSGLWRFAWSHSRDGIVKPGRQMGYFDVAGDPLALAAERAGLCLFLRRDLEPLEEERPAVFDEATLRNPKQGEVDFPGAEQPLALGWVARVGTKIVPTRATQPSANDDAADAANNERGEAANDDAACAANDERGEAANDDGAPRQMTKDHNSVIAGEAGSVIAAAGRSSLQGEALPVVAGEAGSEGRSSLPLNERHVVVEGESGAFTIDTPCTAGGFAESGAHQAGPLRFEIAGRDGPAPQDCAATNLSTLVTRHSSLPGGGPAPQDCAATVWVSSLDGEPIATSSHLLLTHLTDIQNSGIEYADAALTTLIRWGGLPHIMRRGAAEVELSLKGEAHLTPRSGDLSGEAALNVGKPAMRVFRLSSSGKRLGEVPATWDAATGRLSFTARTDWDPAAATYLYEIVRD
jgi:hypothetical protein